MSADVALPWDRKHLPEYDPDYEGSIRNLRFEIGPRQKTDLEKLAHNNNAVTVNAVKQMESDLPGGPQFIEHSHEKRQLTIFAEEGDQITVTIERNTRVSQVQELLGGFLNVDGRLLRIFGKVGRSWKEQYFNHEVASTVKVGGVQSFVRPRQFYKHPIMILGAGFGGIVTAMKLVQRGRTNFVMFDRNPDFGGGSWYNIANKATKLQTESGAYNLEFFFQQMPVPENQPTWPSRDQLLLMFQRSCRQFGLEEYCMFNTKVSKITAKSEGGDRWWNIYYEPVDESADMEMMPAGACLSWPGNLCANKVDDYAGEEAFDGYIEYASLNRVDYTRVTDKDTVIVGHGAFAIENVRTVLEYDCGKIYVVCRRRNITAPKPVSWLVTQHPTPVPGPVLMDALVDGYKLAAWDPWSAYSVTTDEKRSFCRINQGTMFGVTDVYFAAAYYGVMDVVIGHVKKLTHHCLHLKTLKKLTCEVILKTVGVRGDYTTDKLLGIKEMVGFWINGDPLMPCITNSLFVQASNFAGFSIGPALGPSVITILWFVDNPSDFEFIRNVLPRHNKSNSTIQGNALYVYSATHATATSMILGQVPGLNMATNILASLKSSKQRQAHPIDKFLKECEAEWEMYVDMLIAHPKAKQDVDRPPYPYTKESLEEYMRRADNFH